MPSTHAALHFHIVFSTKDREPWFPPSTRERVHAYLGGIVKTIGGRPHCVGGVGDHVHLLISLNPAHRLSDVLRELKADSSRWIKEELSLNGFS